MDNKNKHENDKNDKNMDNDKNIEKNDEYFMNEAIKEGEKSLNEGGIPIGAVLVKDRKIISRGHNRLIQNNSVILHGEMDAIENGGRLKGEDYKKMSLYTTLSPCPMCSGAVILYKISKVIIGENSTLMGAEKFLKDNGVEVTNLNVDKPRELLEKYINKYPEQWKEELEKVGFNTSTS